MIKEGFNTLFTVIVIFLITIAVLLVPIEIGLYFNNPVIFITFLILEIGIFNILNSYNRKE